MTTLIVNLPRALPTAAMLCHGVLSDDGLAVSRTVEAAPALLPANAEVVAVVPACRLSWHRLALPRGALKSSMFQEGNAGRLRAVLDGLLEDSLLDDTSQLHFAIEPQPRADGPVWVAACDKAWLHAWLALLAQAGRPVARIVPEVAPPAGDAQTISSLHVTGSADQAMLMRTGPDGVSLLPLSVASAALMAWPDDAEVLAEPGAAALAEHFFNRPPRLQTAPERWLAAARSDWDLAQFDLLYTRGTRTRKHLSTLVSSLFRAPRWRAARWATLALVVVNLVGLQAWAWKEQSAQAAQRAALQNLLTSTFPDVRVVVDAPRQMARALTDLQRRNGVASSADMETMLGHFQASAPDLPTPAAIEYIANEVRLKGVALSAPSLADIAARLKPHGYSLKMDAEGVTLKEERFP